MKFSRMLVVLIVIVMLMGSLMLVGADNLFSPADSFYDVGFFEDTSRPGVFSNEVKNTTLSCFNIPGLTRDYIFSGHIKIVEIGEAQWTGPRIIIGSGESGYDKFLITKEWGIRVEFKADDMDQLYWDVNRIRLTEGTEFDFEVIRVGNKATLKINGVEEGTLDIPEDKDTFEDDNDYNLGFEACDCWMEISAITVYCDAVKVTAKPTQSIKPSASSSPKVTEKPVLTNAPTQKKVVITEESESNTSTVIAVIALSCVAAAVIIVVGIKFFKRRRG